MLTITLLVIALSLVSSGVIVNWVGIGLIKSEMEIIHADIDSIESRLAVRPADVLEAVQQLNDDVLFHTEDRFRGEDFERFLRANPELKRGD